MFSRINEYVLFMFIFIYLLYVALVHDALNYIFQITAFAHTINSACAISFPNIQRIHEVLQALCCCACVWPPYFGSVCMALMCFGCRLEGGL